MSIKNLFKKKPKVDGNQSVSSIDEKVGDKKSSSLSSLSSPLSSSNTLGGDLNKKSADKGSQKFKQVKPGLVSRVKKMFAKKDDEGITKISDSDFTREGSSSAKSGAKANSKLFANNKEIYEDTVSSASLGADSVSTTGSALPAKGAFSFASILNKLKRKEIAATSSTGTFPNTAIKKTGSKDLSLSSTSAEKNKKYLPLIGQLPVRNQYMIASSAIIAGVIGLLAGLYIYTSTQAKVNNIQNTTVSLIGDFQLLSTAATQAVVGKGEAFNTLTQQKDQINSKISRITNLNRDLKMSGSSIGTSLDTVSKNWALNSKNLEKIEKAKDFLADSAQKADQISRQTKNINDLVERMGFIQYQIGGNQNDFNNVFYLRDTLTKINSSITQILLGERTSSDLVSLLKQDRDGVKKALIEMRWGDVKRNIGLMKNGALISTYNKLGFEWLKFSEVVEQIFKRSGDLVEAKSSINDLSKNVNLTTAELNSMIQRYDTVSYPDITMAKLILYVFAALLALGSIAMFYIYLFDRGNTALVDKLENQKNQNAILRLLDEMSPLSEGDLTKQTTVTEDITGAVADAINVAIEDLGSLVKKIKNSVGTMKEKTELANELSLKMLNLSESQAVNIEQTGESVLNITDAIGKISFRTTEGAKVAGQTVVASKEGSESVTQSIESMSSIKKNMGDTVRLVDRLSDSSEQISNIVDVLSDITEETSVLALNATVQAARAGEAGKSFKIVADSVQALAHKAADATRKVATLIQTTQTDIQDIVQAVQKTNLEVDKGTQLSNRAGGALSEINEVSQKLLEIINSISTDTQQHAQMASGVSVNIKEILTTTKQSQESNKQTAISIGEINSISDDLSAAVKTFKVD